MLRPKAKTAARGKARATLPIQSLPAEPEARPEGAPARHVAIIIPHRRRTADLLRFFEHFAALRARGDRFDVYVVDQAGQETFNRGLLLNAGFRAARAERDYDRYIFHDVDSYPTQQMFEHYAAFPERSVHFASPHLGYKYGYASFLGGVLGTTAADFEAANGFPSVFFGWGGEDNAFRKRLEAAGVQVWRPTTGRFLLADDVEGGDVGNALNPDRVAMYDYDWRHWRSNGLNRLGALRLRELGPDAFFARYAGADSAAARDSGLRLANTESIHTRFFSAEFAKADFQVAPAPAKARTMRAGAARRRTRGRRAPRKDILGTV